MARKLILLTYDVRADVDPEDYDADTRATDYPAFRRRPSILGYSGFRIVKNEVGTVPFTQFDLMWVNDFNDLHTDILGDPDLKKHADRWLEKWSVHGPEEGHTSGRNYQVSFAEEIWG